jgi:tetratricopeptide (TPR) repeat protein
MFRRRFTGGRLLLTCLLLPGICSLAPAQNSPAASIDLARIEMNIQQGKLDEVEKPLLDYAIAHPRDVKALELLGRLRYRQDRLEEARALYQRVLALDPSFVIAKINFAQLTYGLGQLDPARLLLAEIASAPALDPGERLALVRAMVLVGEFQKALAVADKLPAAVKSGSALPLKAASYAGLGDRKSLVALVPSIRRSAGSNPEIAAECAEVFEKAGMSQEALELLRLALVRAPNNFRLLVSLGQMETRGGNFAEARRHLDRAVKINSQTPISFFSFGLLERAEGNYAAALTNLKQARSLAPRSPSILTQLTLTAMQANQPQLAIDTSTELLQLKPDDPESLYLFGAASLQNGSLGAAQSALQRYRQQRLDDPRGCLALGIAFAGQPGKQQEAKAQFEECLKLDPKNVEPRYQLGLIFKSEGEGANAIQLFEEVIALASKHANALRDLGGLYMQSGDEVKGRAVLERAAALNPQDAETHFLLSRLYSLAGEKTLARQHLDLFQKLKSQREKQPPP